MLAPNYNTQRHGIYRVEEDLFINVSPKSRKQQSASAFSRYSSSHTSAPQQKYKMIALSSFKKEREIYIMIVISTRFTTFTGGGAGLGYNQERINKGIARVTHISVIIFLIMSTTSKKVISPQLL